MKFLRVYISAYFWSFGGQFEQRYFGELTRIKELNPGITNREISERLFQMEPLSGIPDTERKIVLDKDDNPFNAFHFIERNYGSYKKYFKKKVENDGEKP